MLEVVISTTSQRMDKAVLEVFDKITQHYDENRYNVEGWKTNSHYLVNKRFISPWCVKQGYNGKIDTTGSFFETIEDFLKALCYLTGENYDNFLSLELTLKYKWKLKYGAKLEKYVGGYDGCASSIDWREQEKEKNRPGSKWVLEQAEWGTWFNWAYFRVKAYKKGTLHIEFKDLDLWGKFNQKVAQLKGYPLYEYKETKATKKADEETAKRYRPNVTQEPEPKINTVSSAIIQAGHQQLVQQLLFN